MSSNIILIDKDSMLPTLNISLQSFLEQIAGQTGGCMLAPERAKIYSRVHLYHVNFEFLLLVA